MSRQFLGKEFRITFQHMKIRSIFSTIREIHIKTTILADKNFDNTMWMKVKETDALTYCWWECKLAQPLWKISIKTQNTYSGRHY